MVPNYLQTLHSLAETIPSLDAEQRELLLSFGEKMVSSDREDENLKTEQPRGLSSEDKNDTASAP